MRVVWYTISQNGRISSLQEDSQSAPEMGDSLPLELPSVPGQSRPELPDLLLSHLMPAAQRLSGQWEEHDALLPTLIRYCCHLALISKVKSISRSFCCSPHCPANCSPQ